MGKKRSRRNPRRARHAFRVLRRNPSAGTVHRPRIRRKGKKWFASRRRRIGPTFFSRRRRHVRHNPRFSVKKLLPNKALLMGAGKIAAGVVLGYFGMPVINAVVPVSMRQYRRFYGLGHVVLGSLMFAVGKKKTVKDIGAVVIAMGMYDLLASNVAALKLPALPDTNGLIPTSLGASFGASYVAPQLVADSYEPAQLSASYAPAMVSGDFCEDIVESISD